MHDLAKPASYALTPSEVNMLILAEELNDAGEYPSPLDLVEARMIRDHLTQKQRRKRAYLPAMRLLAWELIVLEDDGIHVTPEGDLCLAIMTEFVDE